MRKDLRRKVIITLILAIILVLATVLRLYSLSEESLWLDECFTLDYGSKSIHSLVETLKNDVHPIGYYLPQQIMIHYFGSSEIHLRLLSVFFGVLSVYLTFLLGRRLFSWKEGLLAAFFVSISYTSILYSQEAKMYSMFAAFFLLSLFYFVKVLEKPSYLNLLIFSISAALLLHTHILGIAILVGYLVFYLTVYALNLRRKEFRQEADFSFFRRMQLSSRFLFVPLVVLILYLPWLKILVIYQLPLLYNFVGAKLIEKLGINLLPLVVAGAVALVIAYLMVLYLIITDKINLQKIFASFKRCFSFFTHEATLLVLLLGFIVADFFVSTYLFSSVSIVRFCLFILPLLYVFLSRILLKMKRNVVAVIIFVLFVASASVELCTYYSIDSKEQYHEAADYIETHASSADVLYLHRATIAKLCFDYYYSGNVEEVRLIYPGEDDHLVVERTSGKENAYLILSHNFHTQDYFKSRFDSLYRLEDEIQFIGVTIYKYRVNDDPDQ